MQIDWWTLGLQTVNVLILVWILARYLFRPVTAMIAERQTAATAQLDAARVARAEADAAKAKLGEEAAKLATERVETLQQAVNEAGKSLHINADMLKRALNVGFSGGEKKRAEILQMALLKPKMCVLDETDSGLDIDALKIVSEGVNALRDPYRSMLVITHYQRLLNHIVPDVVHVFSDGRVVESGGKELALELEAKGYAEFDEAAA